MEQAKLRVEKGASEELNNHLEMQVSEKELFLKEIRDRHQKLQGY